MSDLTGRPSDHDIILTHTTDETDTSKVMMPDSANSLQWAETEELGDIININTTMAEYSPSLSDVEVGRLTLLDGEQLVVERLELAIQNGDSVSSMDVDVYDETQSSIIDSTNANEVSTDGGTSGSGSAITLRLTNNSGDSQTAMINMYGRII